MSDRQRILVTSALPYANGAIHFGHLAGAYLPADIYVRYKRLLGDDVVYICGSDEHGVSILISARDEKVSPKDIIDRYHALNLRAFEGVGISFDIYSRTSHPTHHETAQEWFMDFYNKGILERHAEQQLFDEQAGMFLPDRFVVGTCPHCGYDRAYGDQCENCSKYYSQTELINPKSLLSGNRPVIREAVHWYFPLGMYQAQLEEYIESHANRWKENVLQQVRSWLKAGLSERPISRDLSWGIPVPLDEAQGKVLYVWFEAVLGYISATKEWAKGKHQPELWKDYWCKEDTRYIAFIGKDNIVFHCLMFPAMLLAKGGYVLPDNVPANEFLKLEGRKFSKSEKWSIEIQDFLDAYPPDPLRYTLIMNMPETRDSDFYWKDFQARNNNELADILGNFVHRTVHFIWKNFEGKIPERTSLSTEDEAFFKEFRSACDETAAFYEDFHFRDGTQRAMNLARASNKYFNDQEPWKTIKQNPERCKTTLNLCVQAIHSLSIILKPSLPFTCEKIRRILNLDDGGQHWLDASQVSIEAGHTLGNAEILFQKIEDEAIEREIAKLGVKQEPTVSADDVQPIKESIAIDAFRGLDLRVGKILTAERIPKSEKLLKLSVDIGIEVRQIVAGIGKSYEPDALRDVLVVVLTNLQTAKLMGVESQGMVLAASDMNGHPILIHPPDGCSPGMTIK